LLRLNYEDAPHGPVGQLLGKQADDVTDPGSFMRGGESDHRTSTARRHARTNAFEQEVQTLWLARRRF
jgi:hypothetical protein